MQVNRNLAVAMLLAVFLVVFAGSPIGGGIAAGDRATA